MSHSPLVSHVNLSPHCTKPRKSRIDTITIHHMAGNLTVEQCGNVFANPSRNASANYGIGSDWPYNCGYYTAVYYDRSDGKVWARDEGTEDLIHYKSDTISCVLRTVKRASAQAIMDAIKETLDFEKRIGLM